MRIKNSDISMQSEHSSLSVYARSESLDVRRGNNRLTQHSEEVRVRSDQSQQAVQASLQQSPSAPVQISQRAQAVFAKHPQRPPDALANASEDDKLDPRLALLKKVIEIMTGKQIHLVDSEDVQSAPAGGQANSAATAPPTAGFSIAYDMHESYDETEQTTVSASGTIQTADGRQIDFTLDLGMSRSYHEETNVSLRAGDAKRQDPLVVNFGGNAAELSDQKFSFDLDGDGDKEKISRFASASGYLALDRNGNGRVDSGKELFGPATNNGYGELATLDGDANGWIDENDAAFSQLKVWIPDQNGGKLMSLKEAGVGALALAHVSSRFELRGDGNSNLGAVKDSGVFLFEDGHVGSMQEIDLTV